MTEVQHQEFLKKVSQVGKSWANAVSPDFPLDIKSISDFFNILKNLNQKEKELFPEETNNIIENLYTAFIAYEQKSSYDNGQAFINASYQVRDLVKRIRGMGIGDNYAKNFLQEKIDMMDKLDKLNCDQVDANVLEFFQKLKSSEPFEYAEIINAYFGSFEALLKYRDGFGNNIVALGAMLSIKDHEYLLALSHVIEMLKSEKIQEVHKYQHKKPDMFSPTGQTIKGDYITQKRINEKPLLTSDVLSVKNIDGISALDLLCSHLTPSNSLFVLKQLISTDDEVLLDESLSTCCLFINNYTSSKRDYFKSQIENLKSHNVSYKPSIPLLAMECIDVKDESLREIKNTLKTKVMSFSQDDQERLPNLAHINSEQITNIASRKVLTFENELEKLVYAAKATEETFRRKNIVGSCDLACFFKTGNINVFTRENNVRDMIMSLDYQKLKYQFIKKIVTNAYRCVQQGINTTNNQVINNIINLFQGNSELSIEDVILQAENIISFDALNHHLLNAYDGNYITPVKLDMSDEIQKGTVRH